MNHVNRYGESNVKPAKGPAPEIISEDEFGMHRTETVEDVNWSHDPRSESAHEKHSSLAGPQVPVSDEKLEYLIFMALKPVLINETADVTINVRSGAVTFTGVVNSRNLKKLIQQVAEGFSEVKDVFNQLQIEA